jgi:hypothetical protein
MQNVFEDASTAVLIAEIDAWNRGEIWAHSQSNINLIIDVLLSRFPLKGESDETPKA